MMYWQVNAPMGNKAHIENEKGILCGRSMPIEWARFDIDNVLHRYLMVLHKDSVGSKFVCIQCLHKYQKAHLG